MRATAPTHSISKKDKYTKNIKRDLAIFLNNSIIREERNLNPDVSLKTPKISVELKLLKKLKSL